MNDLPNGWTETTLEKVVEIFDSRRVPINAEERERRISGKKQEELFPYYGATGQVGYIDDYIFDEPLILLGEDGVPFFDPMRSKAYLVNGKCWVNNHAHVLKSIDGVSDRRYICAYLNAFDYRERVTGTTRLKLTQEAMRKIKVLLAPLHEQKRIAEKLDQVLARVDACQTHLERVPQILKRFRQSVLAAATSGQLTEGWREEKGVNGEWKETTVSEIAEVFLGRQRSPENHYGEHMRKYVRAANITWSGWDFSDVKEMNFNPRDFEKYHLQLGDVLLNEGSGSADEVGKPAIWNDEIEDCCFQNTLLCVRPYSASSKYLYYLFLYTAMAKLFVRNVRGVNIFHIGKEKLANFEISLPPIEEQAEIVRRVEKLFAYAAKLEARYQSASEQVGRFTPSLLAKAFRGELVGQDPNDEPASALVGRIRETRDAQKADPSVKSKKSKRS